MMKFFLINILKRMNFKLGNIIFLFFFLMTPAKFVYICQDTLPQNYCQLSLISEGKQLLLARKCDEGYSCNILGNGLYGVCKAVFRKGLVGESCKYNEECYSWKCINKKCYGKQDKEECLDDKECDWGHYCGGGICIKPQPENGECDKDQDCEIGYTCAKTSPEQVVSKCIKIFSLPSGSYSEKAYWCETNEIKSNTCVIINSKTSNVECKNDFDCQEDYSLNNETFSENGKCIKKFDLSASVCTDYRYKTQKEAIKMIKNEISLIKEKKIFYQNLPEKFFYVKSIKKKYLGNFSSQFYQLDECLLDFWESLENEI